MPENDSYPIRLKIGEEYWRIISPEFIPIIVRNNFTGSRNDTCPCGSGLKFKKCCLIK